MIAYTIRITPLTNCRDTSSMMATAIGYPGSTTINEENAIGVKQNPYFCTPRATKPISIHTVISQIGWKLEIIVEKSSFAAKNTINKTKGSVNVYLTLY